MIVLRALFALLAFLGLICVLGAFGAWLDVWWDRRSLTRKVKAWRRARKRAKITRCGPIQMKARGDEIPYDVDPLTGEPVVLGWTPTELREVEQRPTEFIIE
jgi:uncharacterized iron-regulated membrane protein